MAKPNPHPHAFGALPAEGFVRQRRLLEVLPFSGATLSRKIVEGTFPCPKKLSEKVTAWDVREIRAWFDSQPEASPENATIVPPNRRTKAARELGATTVPPNAAGWHAPTAARTIEAA